MLKENGSIILIVNLIHFSSIQFKLSKSKNFIMILFVRYLLISLLNLIYYYVPTLFYTYFKLMIIIMIEIPISYFKCKIHIVYLPIL